MVNYVKKLTAANRNVEKLTQDLAAANKTIEELQQNLKTSKVAALEDKIQEREKLIAAIKEVGDLKGKLVAVEEETRGYIAAKKKAEAGGAALKNQLKKEKKINEDLKRDLAKKEEELKRKNSTNEDLRKNLKKKEEKLKGALLLNTKIEDSRKNNQLLHKKNRTDLERLLHKKNRTDLERKLKRAQGREERRGEERGPRESRVLKRKGPKLESTSKSSKKMLGGTPQEVLSGAGILLKGSAGVRGAPGEDQGAGAGGGEAPPESEVPRGAAGGGGGGGAEGGEGEGAREARHLPPPAGVQPQLQEECEYSLVVRPGALGGARRRRRHTVALGGGLVAPVPMEVVGSGAVVCNVDKHTVCIVDKHLPA